MPGPRADRRRDMRKLAAAIVILVGSQAGIEIAEAARDAAPHIPASIEIS